MWHVEILVAQLLMFVGLIPTPNIMLCTDDNFSVSIMNTLVVDYVVYTLLYPKSWRNIFTFSIFLIILKQHEYLW